MVIRSLLTVLGYKSDTRQLNNYNQAIQKLIGFAKMAAVAVGGLGVAFVKSAGEMEQTEIAFETMLGSAEAAQKLLQDVRDFAVRTPFQLNELIESSKQLQIFKFRTEEIIPTMKTLGDIAAGVGREKLPQIIQAFGRIKLFGVASMREINSLTFANIPIMDALAKRFNIAADNMDELKKMISAGKVSFEDVQAAMQEISETKFANLMEKQMNTFFGIVSNIQDWFTKISVAIGQKILPNIKAVAAAFRDFLGFNFDSIVQGFTNFFQGIIKGIIFAILFVERLYKELAKTGIFKALGKIIKELFKGSKQFFKYVISTLGWLWKNILKPVIKFISDNIDVFATLGLIILGVVAALKAWAAIQAILNVLLTANPIGLIIAGIVALIFGILMLVKHWDTVVRWLKETGQKIADFLKNTWEGFRDFWIGVWEKISKTAIDIWNGVVASLESTGNSIIETLESAWNGFLGFWKGLWDSISKIAEDIWDGVLKSVGEGWDSFIEGVTGLWNDFMNFIQPAIDVIEGIFGESKEKVTNPFELKKEEKEKKKNPSKMGKEELGKSEATKRFRELSNKTVSNPFEKEISMKGMAMNNRNTTIATTVNMTLPPGTPDEHIRIVRENTDRIINEAIDKRLKQGLVNI